MTLVVCTKKLRSLHSPGMLHKRFSFWGECCRNVNLGKLVHSKAAEPCLQPQPCNVLSRLKMRAVHAMERHTLFAACWRGGLCRDAHQPAYPSSAPASAAQIKGPKMREGTMMEALKTSWSRTPVRPSHQGRGSSSTRISFLSMERPQAGLEVDLEGLTCMEQVHLLLLCLLGLLNSACQWEHASDAVKYCHSCKNCNAILVQTMLKTGHVMHQEFGAPGSCRAARCL
jgi:hypothetical protein